MADNGTITGEKVFKGDVVPKIQAVNSELLKVLETFNQLTSSLSQTTNIKGIQGIIDKTNNANKTQNQLLIEAARLKKEEANATKAGILAKNAEFNLNKKINSQNSKLNSYYKQQSATLNKLRDTYKSLELKKQQGIKLTKTEELVYKKLAVRVKALDSVLKKTDAAAGQFNRNVGNYSKGLRRLGSAAGSFVGAFGFTSGIFLFAAALKDVFKRVREFDKSMQNLSGVLGETRKNIAPIEREVIKVAGASIKTSREVAGLSESLATLGKRGQDLVNLIKPANDLSIALEATSSEAAEFLVQTLNAFDEPSTNAQKFANTITAIRTSTSLDFQRMRDSFQYLTPINKILGKDLADTGAQIGILSDNGLKAESSGRLLGTGLQKLAKEGRTLDEALEEINEAQREGVEGYDLLAIASNLFGKQAAKIGIILANNVDTLEDSAKAIRENGTALNDLVGEQLESLDAKVKILDSTWERLVLTIENGNGSISNSFKKAVGGLTLFLEGLIKTEEAQGKVFSVTGREKGFLDYLKNIHPLLSRIETSYDDLVFLQKELSKGNNNINANGIETLKGEYERLNKIVDENNDLTLEQRQLYRKQISVVTDAIKLKGEEINVLREQAIELGFAESNMAKYVDITVLSAVQLREFIEANKDAAKSLKKINESFGAVDLNTIDALNEKLKVLKENFNKTEIGSDSFKELKKEIADLEAYIAKITGKGRSSQKKIIEGSVKAYQELIKELTELRDSTATSTSEWKKFDDQIAQTERKIKQLKEGIDSLQKIQGNTSNVFISIGQQVGIVDDEIEAPDPSEIQKGITNHIIQEKERERAIIKSINDGILSDYEGFTKAQTEALTQALDYQFELRKRKEDAVEDLVIGGLDSIFQLRIDNIDREIEANRIKLDTVLNNEDLTEKQRKTIQDKSEKEEATLQKKKEKREKQAFLVQKGIALAQIAIDLARTITAINLAASSIDAVTFGIGGIPYRAANIPIAIGTAAAQTGLVLAQAIPAFRLGKDADNKYSGLALLNDGGRDEVRVTAGGEVEKIKGRNVIAPVASDDLIISSVPKFLHDSKNPNSDVAKRLSSNLSRDTKQRQQMVVVNNTDTKGIEQAIYKALAKHKPPIYRPNIVIPEQRITSY